MDLLKCFNWTEYQQKIIKVLISGSEFNAIQISKIAKMPSNKVYQTIGSLIEKNIVIQTSVSPKLYRIGDIDVFMKREIERKQKDLSKIEEDYETFLQFYNSRKSEENNLLLLNGMSTLLLKIENVMENLEYENIGVIEEWSAKYSLINVAKDRIKEGKSVRFIGSVGASNVQIVKRWLKIGAKVGHLDIVQGAGFGVFDGRHIKISIKHQSLKSVWIENESLASILKDYFENLWSRTQEVNLSNISNFENK